MTNIVRLASSRERPVVKACATCRYRKKDGFWGVWSDDCLALMEKCHSARRHGLCGRSGEFWEPRRGVMGVIKDWLFGEGA